MKKQLSLLMAAAIAAAAMSGCSGSENTAATTAAKTEAANGQATQEEKTEAPAASGESIRAAADYYKVDPAEFIVIYDDISLVPGGIRIRKKGSAGGHNGIKNIIAHLGTQEFPRVRIGVGEKPARMDLADYVLGRFPKEEAETMTTAFKDGAAAVVDMMTEGVEAAMNHFNGAARGEKEKLEKQKAERKEEVKTQ